MKKRYIIIADYPNSDHTVGDILYSDEQGRFWVYTDNGRWELHPENYPQIFVYIPE